jgi:hypothetical protein
MVRRVGADRSPAGRGSGSLFLGRRAGMDRRPTLGGHGRFVDGPTASPCCQELSNFGRYCPSSRPGVLRLLMGRHMAVGDT